MSIFQESYQMDRTRRDFVRTTAAAAGVLGAGVGPLAGFGSGASDGLAGGTGDAVSDRPARSRPEPGPLRILILGGTGFIGPHEVEYALERGHTLTLFNRGRTNPGMFPAVKKLRGDRGSDLSALEGGEWDVVLDNSGFYPRHARLSAQLLKDSVDRYMFVSSISAYDNSLLPGAEEHDAPIATMDDPTDESEGPYGPSYGPRKALCEEEVLEAFGEDRTIVVRPGLITGPGDPTDRIRHWIGRMERGGEILVPGGHDDPVQLIDARDMTGWMVRMLENGDTGYYNAVGPHYRMSMAEMVYGIRAVTETDCSFIWVSSAFATANEFADRYSPWIPEGGPTGFMQVANARALATGLTFRSLASIAGDMREEFLQTRGDNPQFGRRGGLPWEREAELLAEWHRTAG